MKSRLLNYLCDPVDKSDLRLADAKYDSKGDVLSGRLISESGRSYEIRDGIPRFVLDLKLLESVKSFGNEWNYFNYDLFYLNWLNYTVKNTFGSPDIFKGKVVVDAGGGSGMQTKWMAEAGADYVICLELSHSVDGIIKKNLAGLGNVDVVQCSIDSPPIKDEAIRGIVMCHNVIQHTPSVEKTATALWAITGPGGEFVFNCYGKNDLGFVRKVRLALSNFLRSILSRCSFKVILFYSRIIGVLRLIPGLGWFLEKSLLAVRGPVPEGPGYLKRAYNLTVLNTFDYYGSHEFQHLKTEDEIKTLVAKLQPDRNLVLNFDKYFSRPAPLMCALRLLKKK